MPKNPIKKKSKHDKFYTKDQVSEDCVKNLRSLIGDNDIQGFVEPSAGGGSFLRALSTIYPRYPVKAFDLQPEDRCVVKEDWFNISEYLSRWVVIGNPPFGSRNSLSMDFIIHAINLGCEIIAFILPSSFEKETTQRVFPEEWALTYSERLGPNCFILNGEDYHVPCTFQVWQKNVDCDAKNLRESCKPKPTTDDFSFVKRDSADFFVFGASPKKTLDTSEVLSNNRGYWIKAHVDSVRRRFSEIDWAAHAKSGISGGAAWYSKDEIIRIYEDDFSEQRLKKSF